MVNTKNVPPTASRISLYSIHRCVFLMEANCVLYGLQTQYTATSCRISSTLLYGVRTLAKLCTHLSNMQCYTQNTEF